MWASWAVVAILVGTVIGLFAMGGLIFALPAAVIVAAALVGLRSYLGKRGTEDVNWMRDQAKTAGPLDKGGVEFTDRDRKTLSS